MVQVTLICAIVGLPQSVSAVKIDTNEVVGILKDAIKAENAAGVRCDARELRLFLAKKDGVWLRDDGDFDKLIQTEGFLDGMEEMRASWELSDPSLFVDYCGRCHDSRHVYHEEFTTGRFLESSSKDKNPGRSGRCDHVT
uniref:Crinkler effector protein N-terminal domain-containing protein n=1 Tax=Hyaloperonospora arabidopsidis (strain Emoy2) TaxID=559515 RepID=M4C5N6_HYAAE